jgi:membrane protein
MASEKAARRAAKREAKAARKVRQDELLHRWPWVWHVIHAWNQFKARNGTQYSAAITYFSFLALFPLLLLAAAITGFVLHSDQHLQQELFDKIAENVPGEFGSTLTKSIQTAINARTGLGVVALAGVLVTGLGWVSNLRQAIDSAAGITPRKQNFLVGRLRNLLVLAGLGVSVLVSLGLTVVGTAVTSQILSRLGISHEVGISLLVKAAGIALSVLGDMVVLYWLLVRLPALAVESRVALKGVVLGAIGLEVLKIVGTFTIARSSHNPTLGPFASLLAVLIWIELVSRFLLYCVAWMSTADTARTPDVVAVDAELPPARVSLIGAAWLAGVGAAAGAAAVLSLFRRPARDADRAASGGEGQRER